ncbi:FISUMP domain-containing protein [Fibrobacter sp. UWEL]|uniref:FISUMP domain-containing protein n=1 Tax=Fibrobacter sp. UWEL TaxID=1896209 RepID=UPI0009342B41|nr:FISUMP domain-containing protein [Fibrobacter sp. UWEL]
MRKNSRFILLVAALLLVSCSVYDNYDIDLMQDATASIDSSSSKGESQGNENDGEKSSSSGETSGASSSSVKNDDSSSSSKKDTTYVVIVNPSSSSQKVESAGSSAVDNPGSSSSKVPDPIESSSSAVTFRCGLDSIVDSEEYLGRKYATVKYGSQCWLAENSYRALEGSKCYGDNEENCEIYGRLYSFDIAKFACPEGTHLPTEEEWITLQTTVTRNNGGLDLKSSETWLAKPGQSGGKFNAKAAGYYDAEEEEFVSLGGFAGFWSSTDVGGMMATYMYLSSSNQNFIDGYKEQSNFYSVRCLKD